MIQKTQGFILLFMPIDSAMLNSQQVSTLYTNMIIRSETFCMWQLYIDIIKSLFVKTVCNLYCRYHDCSLYLDQENFLSQDDDMGILPESVINFAFLNIDILDMD